MAHQPRFSVCGRQVERDTDTADTYKVPLGDVSNTIYAIKVLRAPPNDRHSQANNRQLVIQHYLSSFTWMVPVTKGLCHIFIDDVQTDQGTLPAIISQWHENILEYVARDERADKLSLVYDLAVILLSLHHVGVKHGNIHPRNVMVSSDGQILLADVGLNLLSRQYMLGSGRLPFPPAWAYKPREELKVRDDVVLIEHTFAMDVYSYAVTVHAVFEKKPPFQDRHPVQAINHIINQGHMTLHIARGMSEPLWKLLKRCWNFDPNNRPGMAEVCGELRSIGQIE